MDQPLTLKPDLHVSGGFFWGVGVSGRAHREFFLGKDGIDELKVHGLDDRDDRDGCFILIFDVYLW